MKGRSIPYSAEELTWIEARATEPRRETHAKFCVRFGRKDVNLTNFNALCKRNGWMTGRTGCFAPGNISHNKGRKGQCAAGSEKGWFKKGNEPHNTRFLGHERMTREGYVEVSIDEENPHTGYHRRYVLKHRHEWEKAHGSIPEGHCLKCRTSDKTNCDPSNWALIPRGILPRLNGRFGRNYEEAPDDMKPVILKVAQLEHAVREAGKEAK